MNLADLPWRPMDDVPKDGSVIVVVGHEWGKPSNPTGVQIAQWFVSGLIAPGREEYRPYANGWLTLAEFDKLVNGEEPNL